VSTADNIVPDGTASGSCHERHDIPGRNDERFSSATIGAATMGSK
jgi:hypothetical protein